MNDGVVWVFDNPDIDVYLAFTVKISASHLRKIRYTPYQYELWNICNSMREEGASFPAIAKYLNENGYKSARGKSFKNPHIHSILKKKRIYEERHRDITAPHIENMRLVLRRRYLGN